MATRLDPSVGTTRRRLPRKKEAVRYHGDGTVDRTPLVAIECSSDGPALHLARLARQHLGDPPLREIDSEYSVVRLVLDGRMSASVAWGGERSDSWMEHMAARLAQAVTDQGFGGRSNLYQLHQLHGHDPRTGRTYAEGSSRSSEECRDLEDKETPPDDLRPLSDQEVTP